jgi:hypothetical protein
MRASTVLLLALTVLMAIAWQWSLGHGRDPRVRHPFERLGLWKGGVHVEWEPRPSSPTPSDFLWWRFGFCYERFTRLVLASDHAPGAIAVPQPHSAGPDYDRWFYVRSYRRVFIPILPFVLLAVTVPFLRGVRYGRGWQGRSREARGLCRACGYDLRATPDRCPECGSGAAKAAAG